MHAIRWFEESKLTLAARPENRSIGATLSWTLSTRVRIGTVEAEC